MPYKCPAKQRDYQRDARHRAREMLRDLKAAKGCAVCGETDPDVLDFHHVRAKAFKLGRFAGRTGRDTLLGEAAKCVVLCANHHRKVEARKRAACVR